MEGRSKLWRDGRVREAGGRTGYQRPVEGKDCAEGRGCQAGAHADSGMDPQLRDKHVRWWFGVE